MLINKKDIKKEEIIFIVMKYFFKFGYEKIKFLDIVNEVKISIIIVYSFFKIKYDLYEVVIVYNLDIINFELEKIVDKSFIIDEYIMNIIERVCLKFDKE